MAREFECEVSWGKIAGEEWGNPDGFPWIVLHGWMDNSASWDKLIPYFPLDKYRMICVDWPGHGFSSHYPIDFMYANADTVLWIYRVAEHFRLSKFSLLSHSWGTQCALLFSATFPERINVIIGIDRLHPVLGEPEFFVRNLGLRTKAMVNYKQKIKNPPRQMTYEEAKAVTIKRQSVQHPLSGDIRLLPSSADCLLRRALKKVDEDKYVFRVDPRYVSAMNTPMSNAEVKTVYRSLKSPYLVVMASELNDEDIELSRVVALANPDFILGEVDRKDIFGSHYVHINHPDRTWAQIEPFLRKFADVIANKEKSRL